MSAKPLMYAIMASFLVTVPVWAKHGNADRDHGNKHSRHEQCYFEPHDIRVISEYYAPRYRSLPPGLAKKYYRTGHLPPGWQKKMEPLPVVVERQLVPIPSGYRRGLIDGHVVVYNPGTQVIVDVVPLFGTH
jgi:hypothetical protein